VELTISSQKKKLNILQLSVEYYPLAKAGGMAHVVTDLCTNLVEKGHNVTVIMPLWGSVKSKIVNYVSMFKDYPIQLDNEYSETFSCLKSVQTIGNSTLTFYFINHYNFFGRYSKNLYSHKDVHKRFYFLSRAITETISILNLKPDVIHIHDWMMSLFPEIYKKYSSTSKILDKKAKILLTIHNLAFQGSNYANIHRFDKKEKINKLKALPNFNNDNAWDNINFLKHGVMYSDMVSTVSGTYAKEILTKKYGEGLDTVLRRHSQIYGIINGIDYTINNPEKSKKIYYNYNSLNVTFKKRENKIRLLKLLKFKKSYFKYPVLFTNHRLAYQKGFELILNSFEELMKKEILLIIMGDGDKIYIDKFKELANKYKEKFKFITPFSETYEYKLFAGGDIIICPSVYEPCGIAHLRAMRFGVVPVGRKVGGLADTISDYDEIKHSGTGFIFIDYNKQDFLDSIHRSLNLYKSKEEWSDIVRKDMIQTFGWEQRIDEYISLYYQLIKKKTNLK